MPARNPFAVLGLPHDATAESIKVAWRRLARQHHPDVTSGDKALERRTTRVMAEINAAYQELRDPDRRRQHREAAARAAPAGASGERAQRPFQGRRPFEGERPFDGERQAYSGAYHYGWAQRPRPARPVTARIDTSALFHPRNSTLLPQDRSSLPGLLPRPRTTAEHEPPRASDPTGPTHRRSGQTVNSDLPLLAAAMETRLGFGKFQGLTLGDVAMVEPSYVDWIARTIDRDPELLLAARVVLRYLERSGVIRRQRLDTAVSRH